MHFKLKHLFWYSPVHISKLISYISVEIKVKTQFQNAGNINQQQESQYKLGILA
jgi:hypothetical protein